MGELTQQTAVMPSSIQMLMDQQNFDHLQRVGTMLARSALFPEHLRKGDRETAVANAVLVLNMAQRLQEDPLTVAQNIYFVGGKPGWSTSYLIAKANQHGIFKDPIDWEMTGEGDDLSVTAFAIMSGTGKRVEATCDMAMAKAESWTRNAKYKSMPKTMLRYRSAAALIRFYAPQIMVGVPAQVEVELEAKMKDITPGGDTWDEKPKAAPAGNDIIDADEVAPKREEESRAATKPKADPKKEPEPVQEPDPVQQETAPVEQEQTGHVEPQEQTQAAPDMAEFSALFDQIVNTLLDGDPDQVVGMYEAQIEQMQKHAPDLYANLMEEVNEAKQASQEPG